MINDKKLKESIYQVKYFQKLSPSLRIFNEKETRPNTLRYVDISTRGTFVNIDNNILTDSIEIYKKDNRIEGLISFRRNCDGICLLEVDGRKFLVIVEIKSGYNEIKKKSFEQLIASYVKTRSILQSIEGYNPLEYEEIGFLISYPPFAKSSVEENRMTDTKSSIVTPSPLDRLNNYNATRLSVDGEVILNLTDYKVDAYHVNPALYNNELYIKHIPVTNFAASETINIDHYL